MSNGDDVADRQPPARRPEAPSRLARSPRIVKDGAWVAIGQGVVVAAGLAGTRLLTTILPPAAYGEVSLVIGLGALGAGLLCTPFLQAALRSFPAARDAGAIGALRGLAARYLRRGVTGVALLLGVAGVSWSVWGATSIPLAVFAAAAASVACDTWRTYEAGFLNGARRQREFSLRASLDAIARPAVAVGLAWWLGPSAFHVVLGFAFGSAAVSTILRRHIVAPERRDPLLDDAWARGHAPAFLRYAMPLVPMAGLNWIMSLGDRYLLAGTWGAEAVGVYAAAYALGSQSFIAANALIYTTLRPVYYDAVARGDVAKERRTIRVWVVLVVAVAVAGWAITAVLAKPLCGLLLGPAYGAAAALLPWIAAAYALQMVQQTFEAILYAHDGSKKLVVLQAIAAASAVALYLVLIPRLAAKGAAIGTLGAFVVTTAVAFVLSGAAGKLFGTDRSHAG